MLFDRKKPKPRLSQFETEEKAAEAEAILNHEVFEDAIDEVYSRAMNILIDADVGSLTASTAHATIKALEDIKDQLEQYITDRKMREKYGKGDQNG
jgi:hypothetical protein